MMLKTKLPSIGKVLRAIVESFECITFDTQGSKLAYYLN